MTLMIFDPGYCGRECKAEGLQGVGTDGRAGRRDRTYNGERGSKKKPTRQRPHDTLPYLYNNTATASITRMYNKNFYCEIFIFGACMHL